MYPYSIDNPPRSLEEAQTRVDVLFNEISDIQVQLSDRNRVDPETGRRLYGIPYHEWRLRAVSAKVHREKERAFLKSWISKANKEQREADGKQKDTNLLMRAYDVIADSVDDDGLLSDLERRLGYNTAPSSAQSADSSS